jgi:hypothetical protein
MIQELVPTLIISGFGLIFVVVGLFLLNAGRKARAKSSRIESTETIQIRDMQPGTVELKGTARLPDDETLLESPIQRADALAHHVEVEEWDSSGEGSGNWKTRHESQVSVPMVVDDGSGEVRVELPEDGELNVEQMRTKVGSGDDPPEPIRRYIERSEGIDEASQLDIGPVSVGDRRRYSEGLVEPGEDIYVLGRAHEEQAGWGDRAVVVDEPTAAGDFILSDKSEEELVKEGKHGGLVSLGFGAAFFLVGASVMVVPWLRL